MQSIKENCIHLGHFQILPDSCRVRCDSRLIALEQKSMDVLMLLATRPGQIVTRSEILDAIWPNIAAGDQALNRCISNLRKALNDCVDAPSIIETVPHRGYRLIAECRPASVALRFKQADRNPLRVRLGALNRVSWAGMSALLLALFLFWQFPELRGQPAPRIPIQIISSPGHVVYVAPTVIPSAREDLAGYAEAIKAILIELLANASFVVLGSNQTSTHEPFSPVEREQLISNANVGYLVAAEIIPMHSAVSVRVFVLDAISEDLLWHRTFDYSGDIPAADLQRQLQETLLTNAHEIFR